MKFYHISTDLQLGEREFIPRVPKYRCKDEDSSIKRICVCPTIRDAISAFPYKGKFVNWDMRRKKNNYLSVYKLKSNNFLTDEQILDKVPDAYLTKEHWILEPVKATPTLIKIKKLTLSKYNKYTSEYSGEVKSLEYETDISDCDREEEFVFISKKNFKKFSKIAAQNNIQVEVLEDKHVQMPHHYYNDPTTKKYRWIKVKIHIPAGVSIAPLWLIDEEQNNLAMRKKFSIKEWVYDEFWWEMD